MFFKDKYLYCMINLRAKYECGFIGYTEQTRNTYSIQFYIIAMLFLIFDLEILLVFPATLSLHEIGMFGFSMMLVFFSLLTIGFVLEIGSGAISLTNYDRPLSNEK